jgi:hypothetical protein
MIFPLVNVNMPPTVILLLMVSDPPFDRVRLLNVVVPANVWAETLLKVTALVAALNVAELVQLPPTDMEPVLPLNTAPELLVKLPLMLSALVFALWTAEAPVLTYEPFTVVAPVPAV